MFNNILLFFKGIFVFFKKLWIDKGKDFQD